MKFKNQSSALQRCILQTDDPDQQAGNLTNWQQEYDQMSDGAFYGTVDKLTSQNLHVFREYSNQALHQQCQIWPDAIWFGIPLENNKNVRINGQGLMNNALATRVGDHEFELVTPEDFTIYGVVLENTFLNQIAELQGIELREMDIFKNPALELDPKNLDALKHHLGEIVGENSNKMAAHIKEDILISSLINALPENGNFRRPKPSYQHRKQVVERVKSYIHEHQQVPVTMTELCQIAYVSRRTLQYSFETILGYSPLKFLRMTRLNQVRRALKNAPKESTVVEIAETWGFTHAGQFSSDYKKLFGESPSETLRKSH
ncbi:helix-turn-helix domain-containing protein [Thiomicrorhabdus sp.]|uniref:helix-turn-helix domain-containing protein n=1 Tax=Thiomicrorhabdus sp. TaxID=2039724 RepID=UPI002AA6DC59|nr:helix-turn-helix domain-containing protein [Thiomicrorhabdus sp.]